MAYKSSKDVAGLWMQNFNIGPFVTNLHLKVSAGKQDTRGLGLAWPVNSDTGTRSGELEVGAFYDSANNSMLGAVTYNRYPVSLYIDGNAPSDRFYGWQSAQITAVEAGITPDEFDSLTPEFTIAGEVNYGYLVAPLYYDRGAGANTDLTYATMASSAASGHAFLHVYDVTLGGSTSCTVTVRHSDDHVTFAPHTAFTNITGMTGEVIALPTLVNKYLSISWAWNGAGSGQKITFLVGVAVD